MIKKRSIVTKVLASALVISTVVLIAFGIFFIIDYVQLHNSIAEMYPFLDEEDIIFMAKVMLKDKMAVSHVYGKLPVVSLVAITSGCLLLVKKVFGLVARYFKDKGKGDEE